MTPCWLYMPRSHRRFGRAWCFHLHDPRFLFCLQSTWLRIPEDLNRHSVISDTSFVVSVKPIGPDRRCPNTGLCSATNTKHFVSGIYPRSFWPVRQIAQLVPGRAKHQVTITSHLFPAADGVDARSACSITWRQLSYFTYQLLSSCSFRLWSNEATQLMMWERATAALLTALCPICLRVFHDNQ